MDMKNLLENAGLTVTDGVGFTPYIEGSDVKLPFRKPNIIDIVTSGTRDDLDHMNYIRRTAEIISPEKFDAMTPEIGEISDCKKWLRNLCERGRVRLVNRGSIYEISDGIIGEHSDYMEREFKSDTGFFFDTVYMFEFNPKTMRIEMDFSAYALQNHNMYEVYRKFRDLFEETNKDILEIQYLFVKEYLESESEFVPFFVKEDDGCRISHKKFKDEHGAIYEEVTSPCYGINIKKHPDIMARLQNWLSKGAYIKDNNRYLICKDRDSTDLYLRKYEQ